MDSTRRRDLTGMLKLFFDMRLRLGIAAAVLLAVAGIGVRSALGQAVPSGPNAEPKVAPAPTVGEITRESVQKRLDVLKDSQEPTDLEVVRVLGEALKELDRAEQAATQAAQWEATIRSAPDELRRA